MSNDIGWLHADAYANGQDPIDHAIEQATLLLDTAIGVAVTRCELTREAFPTIPTEDVAGWWARRLIGTLLDAGWTAPSSVTS